jgi:hypothetical protein
MSFYKIAQDYFNSPKQCKLPQDFKSTTDMLSGINIHSFSQPNECFYPPHSALETLNKPETIEHFTMFLLFSSIALSETEWEQK